MVVSNALLSTYRSARYQFTWEGELITLKVDQIQPRVAQILEQEMADVGFFITACNPRSEQQSEGDNGEAMAKLALEIYALDGRSFSGVALDPEGRWPAELSYFVIGISASLMHDLAQDFSQNAYLSIDQDGRVSLRQTDLS